MSMFDIVTVDYPLPVEGVEGKMESPPKWNEIEYQSLSLDCTMQKYTIEEDGQLYKEGIERELVEGKDGSVEIKERELGISKQEFTGELRFYCMHLEGEKDFFPEFLALFWKGELKEITLENLQIEDSAKRELAAEKMMEEVERQFTEPNLYTKTIRHLTHPIRWVLGLLIKICWKIERLGS